MPVPGRKQKPDARNRNPDTHDWILVPNEPFTEGEKLGRRPGGGQWPVRTKRWWATVSSMPHCVIWTAADWEFAFDTAQLAAEFHEGDMARAAELRIREKVLGTTADFRRDLRIRYVDPGLEEMPEMPEVASIDDYRSRLG